MAPLSGIGARPPGPAWNRACGLPYRHGEQFYHFKGLRHFKKFAPVWSPECFAAPGGLSAPAAPLDVTTLISGGQLKLVAR